MSRIPILLMLLVYYGFHATVSSFSIGIWPRHPRTASSSWSMSSSSSSSTSDDAVDFGNVGIVLLAGGTGSRMKANMPKQFLPLDGVPVLHYSLDLFLERLPAHAHQQGMRCVPSVHHSVNVVETCSLTEIIPTVDRRLSFWSWIESTSPNINPLSTSIRDV